MTIQILSAVRGASVASSLAVVLAGTLFGSPADAAPPKAKNIIMLIADGAGYDTLRSTELWQGEAPGYATAPGWIALPLATYSLRTTPTIPVPGEAGLAQDPAIVYDPALAWNTAPQEGGASGFPYFFAGYKWLRDTDPDSANTMTAMVTGVKTYNNAINVDGNGVPLLTLPEIAKSLGKSVGSISSVPLTHATVAVGAGAHNINRNNYHELATEIFGAGVCDVIGGGGNPDFDSQGEPAANPNYLWIPEGLWTALKTGELPSNDGPNWTLVQSREDIEAMVGSDSIPTKLAIVPHTFDTLQETRTSSSNPLSSPLRATIPSRRTCPRS